MIMVLGQLVPTPTQRSGVYAKLNLIEHEKAQLYVKRAWQPTNRDNGIVLSV